MSDQKKKYSYSFQYTKFRANDPEVDETIKYFGKKVVKDEEPHINHIGKNVDVCRRLLGLGQVLKDIGYDFGFDQYANHVWLRQINESDPNRKLIRVCINCASIMDGTKFVPFTDLTGID